MNESVRQEVCAAWQRRDGAALRAILTALPPDDSEHAALCCLLWRVQGNKRSVLCHEREHICYTWLAALLLRTEPGADQATVLASQQRVRLWTAVQWRYLVAVWQDFGVQDWACACVADALRCWPKDAVLLDQGLDCAVRADAPQLLQTLLQHAMKHIPTHPRASFMMGNQLAAQGDFKGAEACFRCALQQTKQPGVVGRNLARSLYDQGRLTEAIAVLRNALQQDANLAGGDSLLGSWLIEAGALDEAERCFRRVLAGDAGHAMAWNNLGNVLRLQQRQDEALHAYQCARDAGLDNAVLYANLGNVYHDLGQLGSAIACYRQGLARDADDAELLNNLANVLKDTGAVEEASAAYRRALELAPEHAAIGSNYLQSLNYLSGMDAGLAFREHRHWAKRIGSAITPLPWSEQHASTDKRLTLAYVSADFRTHSVAFFLKGLLQHHDRSRFRIILYANVIKADALTLWFQGHCDLWRDIVALSDEQAAHLMRQDGVDVLVDLAGHTAWNRLPVLAYRPARVQFSYLGYPNTTGMPQLDGRLVDAWTDPDDAPDVAFYTETLWRLPHGFLAYTPPDDAPGLMAGPEANGIRFACFNNHAKLSVPLFSWWAEILQRVPGSVLVLKNSQLTDLSCRIQVWEDMAARGIARERIHLLAKTATQAEHMACYNSVDLALDSYPYHGTTTSCEALWMGVPVISLTGDRHASRVGASLLQQLGRVEWLADSPKAYVDKAVALASSGPRSLHQREALRERMRRSVLCDAALLTREVEACYQQAWQQKCVQT